MVHTQGRGLLVPSCVQYTQVVQLITPCGVLPMTTDMHASLDSLLCEVPCYEVCGIQHVVY